MSTPDIPPDIAREYTFAEFVALLQEIHDRNARTNHDPYSANTTELLDEIDTLLRFPRQKATEPGEFVSETEVRCPKCGNVQPFCLVFDGKDVCETCKAHFPVEVRRKRIAVSPPLETEPTKGGEHAG